VANRTDSRPVLRKTYFSVPICFPVLLTLTQYSGAMALTKNKLGAANGARPGQNMI